MKKRDLFLAGLLLCSVSAFAQPQSFEDDAKVIFTQDFEGDAEWQKIQLNEDPKRPTTLYTWQEDAVDFIDQVEYYKRQDANDKRTDTIVSSSSTINNTDIYSGSRDWEIAGVRDTIMLLYNGVMRTDAVWPDDSILNYDQHAIVAHTAESQSGTGIGGKEFGLDRFGEDGGDKYFRYTSANGTGVSNYSSGYVPEYRRNLFIRLNPGDIEPNSSYRVTVFVKATQQGSYAPRLGLELMRGFFHGEKNFVQSLADSREFNSTQSFEDFEEGKWQKITLMAFYNNDSVSNGYVYKNGYWWPDDWIWRTKANKDSTVNEDGDTTMIFRYIKQPDKFFVRLSFRSDSTRFDVDNLSLTKSWIAGVEHYNDMIRVDFGYDTNLGQKAEEAKKINKIATVEVPGEYFDVWANFGGEWEEMPILSAEYQGDGYMYMWTKPFDDGTINSFEGADEVLVSFRNPIDREDLALQYTGNLYPRGIDTAWINQGKYVMNFHNEISYLNPTITISPKTGKAVKSLKNLAPVMQYEPYEDGTFGLPSNLRSMKFKFSRTLAYDNFGASTNLTQVTVKQGGTIEYWDITESDESGMTTITRPAKYTAALAGDYVIAFKQVTHLQTPDPANEGDYGDDVALNYHFGEFNPSPVINLVAYSNWRDEIADYNDGNRPVPTSLYIHSGTDKFQQGTGVSTGTKCGFYPLYDDTITVAGVRVPDNGLFYLSNRTGGATGNLYAIEHFKAGQYTIEFKFGGQSSTSRKMSLYFYAKPEGELVDGDDNGFAVLQAVADKIQLEKDRTPKVNMGGSFSTSTKWNDGIETLTYNFSVPADGDYVFEWVASGSTNYEGIVISNYWIKNSGDLSFAPVGKLNEAIATADAKLKTVSADKFKSPEFTALSQAVENAKAYNGKVKAAQLGVPSKYDSVVATLTSASDAMDVRVAAIADFEGAEASIATALGDETYKNTGTYAALADLKTQMATIDIASKTNDELAALVAEIKAGIGSLEKVPYAIRRIQELNDLSVKLGSTVNQQAPVADKLAVLDSDDDDLAAIFKAAIKLAIYQKAAANVNDKDLDSLVLNPFIKNYFLYVTPKYVERTSINANANEARVADANGAQIQHVGHQWNTSSAADAVHGQMPIWIMITENDYSTLYPGWTVRATASGNHMITPDGLDGHNYNHLRAGENVFDGQLAMDWSGKAEIKSTVTDLPNGYYSLGVELKEHTGNGTSLTAKADGNTYEVKPAKGNTDGAIADSFLVANGNIDIDLILTSDNGWSQADNFFLTFYPNVEFDYAGAVSAQQTALDNLITVVNANEVEAANVELFTIGGVKVLTPKSGDILIRKTTDANGKIAVDKILLK